MLLGPRTSTLLTVDPYEMWQTSYPSHSGLLRLWLEHSLGFLAWGRGRGGCLIRIHCTQAPLSPAPDPVCPYPTPALLALLTVSVSTR